MLVFVPQRRLIPVGTKTEGGFGKGGSEPKLNTQTVSLPSTATPHGKVMPPPLKGANGCCVLAWISVTNGLLPAPKVWSVEHGTSSQSEFATHIFPLLSAPFPMGWLK